jgi:Amt family ammonium transporter
MKFKSFIVFVALWSLLVYSPVAHWVCGVGGWIRGLGALDFAGGTVVHINAGAAALAAALLIGRRKGFASDIFSPHNMPMTVLGAAILWFGWFGFNAGSALSPSGVACSAFLATNLGAAAGLVSWPVVEWIHRGRPTTLGAASGAVAGLVAITPASGFVGPLPAILIGLVAGAVCYAGVLLKWRWSLDDSLDVVAVHGLGGTVGALLTGVFASTAVNPAGGDGLWFGNAKLLGLQALAVGATWAYSFFFSLGLLKIVDLIMGLRVSDAEEDTGLDLSQHSEAGYAF